MEIKKLNQNCFRSTVCSSRIMYALGGPYTYSSMTIYVVAGPYM